MSSWLRPSLRPSSSTSLASTASKSSKNKDKNDDAASMAEGEEVIGETEDGKPLKVDANEEEALTIKDGETQSDNSKLKQFLVILKKMLGVKDLAAVRLSLPSNLLEPVGNLEYWCYLDRPDFFAALADSDDPLDRMIDVCRWAFTKELKFIHGGIVKPYNSALGEQFRCFWDVTPITFDSASREPIVIENVRDPATGLKTPTPSAPVSTTNSRASSLSENSDLSSGPPSRPGTSDGNKPGFGGVGAGGSNEKTPTSSALLSPDDPSALNSGLGSGSGSKGKVYPSSSSTVDSATSGGNGNTPFSSTNTSLKTTVSSAPERGKARAVFLNEQVCHHPPISTFWYESRGAEGQQRVIASGVDQISARFTGTSVRIVSGSSNKGIFVEFPDRNQEEYEITHPSATVTGLLRASPYVTVTDHTYVTRTGGKDNGKQLRAVLHYVEEGWISKPRFQVKGVIYECDGPEDLAYEKVRDVPPTKVLVNIEGTWRGKLTYKKTKGPDKSEHVLIDLERLAVADKTVRPIENQHEMESRRFWEPVTESIKKKEYGQATKNKQTIEQKQRDKAAEHKKKEQQHEPIFFSDKYPSGRPSLTERGRKAIEDDFAAVGY